MRSGVDSEMWGDGGRLGLGTEGRSFGIVTGMRRLSSTTA